MTVLVVDGSVVLIERWQRILIETGYIKAVYGAVSYNDALRLFIEINPDLVLLDDGLAASKALDLLIEMKERCEKIQVIILENSNNTQIKEKYIAHGASMFFDKYNDFEKIPGAIKRIAQKKIEDEQIKISQLLMP
jgi:DNA-binding NarL/FixJ family response regulator